jgi:peptidyl-prolyl cis-trans isomerase A (cyclophilin A)
MGRKLAIALNTAAFLVLTGCSSPDESRKAEAPAAPAKKEPVPDVFHVKLDTSKGLVDIEVHRDWAPAGADHFYDLVKSRFYDGARFFRVVRGFVVQFGINGDPQTNALWASGTLLDDPVKQHNVKGAVTYAKPGPNGRTTQLFINLGDNRKSLDRQGFAPIGQVVEGMPVVESLYDFYGDMPPSGQGPDPNQIQRLGNAYLESHFPRLDFIVKASVR